MVIPLILLASMGADASPGQYAFTFWDWEATYRDFDAFKGRVDACAGHGITLIEMGAGWRDCEPERDRFDFSMVDERVAYVTAKGLGVRFRVNMADWPDWFQPERFQLPNGDVFEHSGGYPSVFNEENRKLQHRFAGELAQHFAGRGYTYTPGFSVHMEVKFADWNTYEPSARQAFRHWLAGRYETIGALNDAWGADYAAFAEIEAPVPADTEGRPSLDPAANDWIRFREFALADWVNGFARAVRGEDPTARVSVPLGESYRRQSAAFANLGYWAYSRAADEIVHSYDFFWHGPQGLRNVEAAVATMTGITTRPVVFEIDGPYLLEDHGYEPGDLVTAATRALSAGAAGIQVSNWGDQDLAGQTWMTEIAERVRNRTPNTPREPHVLYYVSKWQAYCFRERSDWVHDRQFGLWFRLADTGIPARIVTDENLLYEELLAPCMVVPFGTVMDVPVRERLRALSYGMRVMADEKPGVFTANRETAGRFGARIDVTGAPFNEDNREPAAILRGDGEEAQRLRVAVVQFFTTFDIASNTARILEYVEEAAAQSVRVVVFTEMALTGYTGEAAFRDALDWDAVDAGLARIREACQGLGVYAVVGAPTRDGEDIFCAAVVIGPDGAILDAYEKNYLAGEAWATPGRKVTTFSIDGATCGTIICHDERYGPLVQLRALKGAQLFFYISCESGVLSEGKIGPYRAQIQARAVENGVYIVHANAPGDAADPHRAGTSHGESRIIAPDGTIIQEASMYGETMIVVDIDLRHAAARGLGKAVTSGPLAGWMQDGLDLVTEP